MERNPSGALDEAAAAWAYTEERKAFIQRLRQRKRARQHRHMSPWMVRFKAWVPEAEAIRKTWIGRALGRSIMRRECWSFKPHNAALGLGLGMFVAWTPTIGAQMPLAAILCCVFSANIPLGVMGVWFSNPLFYAASVYVGFAVLGLGWPSFPSDCTLVSMVGIAVRECFWPMAVGSVVLGLPSAAMTYFSAYGFAHWQRRHHLLRMARERNAIRRERWKKRISEARASRAERRLKRHARRAAGRAARAAERAITHGNMPRVSSSRTSEGDASAAASS